jgi:LmbE family N-acetylglucosaminyl deacetylase
MLPDPALASLTEHVRWCRPTNRSPIDGLAPSTYTRRSMADADDALDAFPEDWQRGLAVVAHPDDMEYGAAAAVARWTAQGKQIAYVLVSDGEAGISSIEPERAGPIRRDEQIASCEVVGVDDVEFLGWPDGTIVEGLDLRAALTETIRRHRPEIVLSINFRESWGPGSWNHADHRAVGRGLLDAVRDAGNPWVFSDRGTPWDGTRFVAFSGSPQPTHAVDTTDTFDIGVRSLATHRVYLDNLGGDMSSPETFLRPAAEAAGTRLGTTLAATFEIVG